MERFTRYARRGEVQLAVLLLAALPLFAAPAAGGPTANPSDTRAERYRLVASAAPDRSNPVPLNGRTLTQAVQVFVAPTEGIKRVRYEVDGKRFGNRRGFSTMPLAHGGHAASATIVLASGKEVTLRARFRVEHLFVSATGHPFARCTTSAPCGTFQRAYNLAQPGQVVEVLPGTYPEQELTGTRAAPVVFRPAPDASVTVDFFDVYADQVELRDFKTGGFNSYAEVDGLTARNLDMNIFGVYGSSNVSIIGGDVGPSYIPGGQSYVNYITYGGPDDARVKPRNIVIDGVYFHDFRRGTPDDHMECLMVIGGDGITVRNSRFQRCDVFSIFFTQWAGPEPPKNIRIENNFFDVSTLDGSYETCCTYYAVLFAAHMVRYENVTIRNNSTRQALAFSPGPPKINVRFIANVGPLKGCPTGASFAYNVWEGAKCGRTDRNAPSGFVDPGNLNLHLKPGAAAINRGDPSSFPTRDIDGQRRPMGRRPDAGADEAR